MLVGKQEEQIRDHTRLYIAKDTKEAPGPFEMSS